MHPEALRHRSEPELQAARFCAIVAFPEMRVGVRTCDEAVVEITYLPPSIAERAPANALAARALRQLERYRADADASFDLPLAIEGTDFQRRVWAALCEIPRGRTLRYGEMAKQLGSAARAVGQACGANRLPVVIPCHRVVAAGGLGGFAHHTDGYLLEAKRWLLVHEGALAH